MEQDSNLRFSAFSYELISVGLATSFSASIQYKYIDYFYKFQIISINYLLSFHFFFYIKMWTYYGTKKRIAKNYPAPIYDTIIEPFASAAQYSLYGDNWKKKVILLDKYDVVSRVWDYLINTATKERILALPNMNIGDKVDDLEGLCQEEKWLIGFCINSASAMPKKTAAKFNHWDRYKNFIAENLYKVKHWEIRNGDYTDLDNIEATWFIDPPYQYGGKYYRYNNKGIDYVKLADWCKNRNGQVIVCENTKADWLDFKPLVEMNGQLHKTMEAIWYKKDNSATCNAQ